MFRRWFLTLFLSAFDADAAEQESDDLVERMNRFAAAYNDFTGDLAGGMLSVKKAGQLSRLWRRVETCEEWPRVG